ncbi:MAG: diacylglycerol kinase [Gammaproteobacteria bacterium]|nr:diacylglycerol kinase [Gammaproteobacteria bacterium]
MTTKHADKSTTFNKKTNTGLTHLVNSTRFSLAGLKSAFRHESAFRQELMAFALLLPSGVYLSSSLGQAVGLLCACCLVLSVELLNSAVEAAIDRIGTEYHELSKLAKDYGSAAVMISLAMVGIVWAYIVFEALSTSQ